MDAQVLSAMQHSLAAPADDGATDQRSSRRMKFWTRVIDNNWSSLLAEPAFLRVGWYG